MGVRHDIAAILDESRRLLRRDGNDLRLDLVGARGGIVTRPPHPAQSTVTERVAVSSPPSRIMRVSSLKASAVRSASSNAP